LPRIRLLPEALAHKIAAGEAIERPASVVKELVENAIDAGAQKVSVSVSADALSLLRVSDNGEGMTPDDAELAFSRHATSKLQSEEDLCAIATFGFRGEALPSIATVSRVRLTTQTVGATGGIELSIEAGVVTKRMPIGIPVGSTLEVSDLFFNTPVRKKFLKSQQTEIGHIHEAVLQPALIYPAIHFRLTVESRVLLDAPPVATLTERARQLFARETIDGCRPICDQAAGVAWEGLVSAPPLRRSHRKHQYLFVNGRPIKNATLTHAVYDAYGSLLMKGEHPFFILSLSVDPATIDVNVHPTKKDVRFQYPDRIHSAIVGRLRSTLSTPLTSGTEPAEFHFSSPPPTGSRLLPTRPIFQKVAPTDSRQMENQWIGWPEADQKGQHDRSDDTQDPLFSNATAPFFENALPSIRPLGQVYDTFLLAEVDGEMMLIDQHTAHERLLYEQLLEDRDRQAVQPYLIPPQVDLPPSAMTTVLQHLDLLLTFGWKVEPFGAQTVLVREAPAQMAGVDPAAMLAAFAEEIDDVPSTAALEARERAVAASMACHSAVRAGRVLSLEEIRTLLTDFFKRKTPPTCPHGRPVFIRYPLGDLEKLFRRI